MRSAQSVCSIGAVPASSVWTSSTSTVTCMGASHAAATHVGHRLDVHTGMNSKVCEKSDCNCNIAAAVIAGTEIPAPHHGPISFAPCLSAGCLAQWVCLANLGPGRHSRRELPAEAMDMHWLVQHGSPAFPRNAFQKPCGTTSQVRRCPARKSGVLLFADARAISPGISQQSCLCTQLCAPGVSLRMSLDADNHGLPQERTAIVADSSAVLDCRETVSSC